MKQTVETFDSIGKFYDYLCQTPFNDAFRWSRHASVDNDYSFTKTHSFEYATELLKHGWETVMPTLVQKLQIATKHDAPVYKQRNVLSVSGYQPVVPLYLAGVPTNMISKQLVAQKSKIVNITKLVNYNGGVGVNTMIDESIKAMQIVKKLEAQGYRCNLFVALGTEAGSTQVLCKVKVKGANEKLNISKLSFPMVHPSMLRRLFFRFIEVHPDVTKQFVSGYGHPVSYSDMCKAFKGDIVLPSIFTSDVENITDLESLKASV